MACFYVREVGFFHAAGNRRVNRAEHRACNVGKSHPRLGLVLDRRENWKPGRDSGSKHHCLSMGESQWGRKSASSIQARSVTHYIEDWKREWGIGHHWMHRILCFLLLCKP